MKRRDYSKNPGRPKDAVIDERIDEMVVILSSNPRMLRAQLHSQFTVQWKCHWKTVDRIVGRARKEIFNRLNRSREEFRCESLAFYEAKAANPEATVTEQIRARQSIDALLGLNAPQRTELSGPEGQPIVVETKSKEPFDFDTFRNLQSIVLGPPEDNGSGEFVHPSDPNAQAGGILKRNGS